MTAPLTEAEAGAALFGWLAEAKHWMRHVIVGPDHDGGGYLCALYDRATSPANGFSGATRAEALMAAARGVLEGKAAAGKNEIGE